LSGANSGANFQSADLTPGRFPSCAVAPVLVFSFQGGDGIDRGGRRDNSISPVDISAAY